jgi:endonuclease YncB( thermonuclease family)
MSRRREHRREATGRPDVKQAIAAIMIATASAAGALSANAETLNGPASIIDGDSIEIGGERIHILDIDAPERGQFCFRKGETLEQGAWPCGEQAALALSGLIGQQNVACETLKRGTDKGWLARCTVAGEDLARWLAANGWAVPAQSCKCEVVRSTANQAESARRGIWSSAFTMPWDWRKAH